MSINTQRPSGSTPAYGIEMRPTDTAKTTLAGLTADTNGNLCSMDKVGSVKRIGGLASILSAAGTAVGGSASEAVSASYTIPANTLTAGSVVRVRFQGIATATVGTDTLQYRLRLGPTTLTGTSVITSTATDVANNDTFVGEFEFTVRDAPSASSNIVGFGSYSEPAGTALKLATLAATAFATNGALRMELTLKWSTANANSARVDHFTVEII